MRMDMPFGKHKGTPLDELPDDYLVWLYDLDNLFPPLRRAVDEEYESRWGPAWEAPPPPPPVEPRATNLTTDENALLTEMLRAGYRALALKNHPDQGGSTGAMEKLNLLMEKVRRLTWFVNGK